MSNTQNTEVVKSDKVVIPVGVTRKYERVIMGRGVYFRNLFSDEK